MVKLAAVVTLLIALSIASAGSNDHQKYSLATGIFGLNIAGGAGVKYNSSGLY